MSTFWMSTLPNWIFTIIAISVITLITRKAYKHFVEKKCKLPEGSFAVVEISGMSPFILNSSWINLKEHLEKGATLYLQSTKSSTVRCITSWNGHQKLVWLRVEYNMDLLLKTGAFRSSLNEAVSKLNLKHLGDFGSDQYETFTDAMDQKCAKINEGYPHLVFYMHSHEPL